MYFLLLSTWTWYTFLTLMGTWGFRLNHVLTLRPSKSLRVGGVGQVAHKILETARVQILLSHFWIWAGTLDWDLDSGLSI